MATPSRLQMYYDGRVALNPSWANQDTGTTNRTVIKNLVTLGACPEPDWPYDEDKVFVEPPALCYELALDHQAVEYLTIPTDINLLRTCLDEGYPFVFAMTLYENFRPDARGLIPMPAGSEIGGHAMVGIGYFDEAKTFLIRNSWGDRWGVKGHCLITYDHMRALGRDIWTLRKTEIG